MEKPSHGKKSNNVYNGNVKRQSLEASGKSTRPDSRRCPHKTQDVLANKCSRERSTSRTRTPNNISLIKNDGLTSRSINRPHGGGHSLKATSTPNVNKAPSPVVANREQNFEPKKGPTWEKMLTSGRSSEAASVFNPYNPVNTLNFLTKELQCKVNSKLPCDDNIKQIVRDIQVALNRLPKEIATSMCLEESKNMSPRSGEQKSNFYTPIKTTADKGCQTMEDMIKQCEYRKFQEKMEESTKLLDATSRKMELFCTQIYTEKNNLELQLQEEKKRSKRLQKELDKMQTEKMKQMQDGADKVKELEGERHQLRRQLAKQQQRDKGNEEYKRRLEEAKQKNEKLELECRVLKETMRKATLEISKCRAVILIRENQVKEFLELAAELKDSNDNEPVEGKGDGKETVTKEGSEAKNSTLSPITNEEASKESLKENNKSANNFFTDLISHEDISDVTSDDLVPFKGLSTLQ